MVEEEKPKEETAGVSEPPEVVKDMIKVNGPAMGKTETIPDSLIDQAKKVNVAREEILDREEKLQARKEKLHAEEMVAGKGQMAKDPQTEENPHEYRMRVEKELAAGMAAGRTEFGN